MATKRAFRKDPGPRQIGTEVAKGRLATVQDEKRQRHCAHPSDLCAHDETPTLPAGPPSMPPSSTPIPAAPLSPRIAVVDSAADARADVAERNVSSPPSLSALSVAVARAPLKAAPYLSRALLEIERNQHLKAERTLAKVLSLAPDLAEAHYRMGLLLARRGSLSAARRSFLNALQAATASGEEALRWISLVGAELARLERR